VTDQTNPYLIISADDFGRFPREDEAIENCVSCGPITSVSVMVNMVSPRASDRLKRLAPRCSVGLHLNLTEGLPVSDPRSIPSLVDGSGSFWGFEYFMARLLTGRLRGGDIFRELCAQVSKGISLFGRPLHADTHKHIHQLPAVLPHFIAAVRGAGINDARTLRQRLVASSVKRGCDLPVYVRRAVRRPLALLALPLKHWAHRRLRAACITTPDFLLSPFPRISAAEGREAARAWLRVLRALTGGLHEVNFHPGSNPSEYSLLLSPEFREALNTSRVVTVPFQVTA